MKQTPLQAEMDGDACVDGEKGTKESASDRSTLRWKSVGGICAALDIGKAARAATARQLVSKDEVSWGESGVKRIGVPGGTQLNVRQATRFIFRWHGTAFKAALTSVAAVIHLAIYGVLCVCATHLADREFEDPTEIRVYMVDEEVTSSFTFILAFVVSQYIGFVVQRYTDRLSICIDTGEAASQVTFEAAVMLRGDKKSARQLVRYVHLLLHLYYMTVDSGMNDAKWDHIARRGLVTPAERSDLQGVDEAMSAVYVWALEIIHTIWRQGSLSDDHAVRMECELSEARRQASRQKDYHESPIPMPFFHLMMIMCHAYLLTLVSTQGLRPSYQPHALLLAVAACCLSRALPS